MVTDDQPLPHLYRRISRAAPAGSDGCRHRMGRHLHLRLYRSRQRDRPHTDLDRLQLFELPIAAYALGAVVVVGLVYLLGLVVESRLESRVRSLIDSLMQRIPFVGNLYDVTKRFVAIMDRKDQDGLKSMSPVWCFFGGKGGAAVLGLLPMPKPIMIDDRQYHVVLVPSAPVPVGGCLVYVPVEWVRPADFGVEALMSIYVSMGVTTPQTVDRAPTLRS